MQVGAVFGLIFALIVMGLFLVFGSGQMANIMCLGNVGQTSKAVKSLESLVDDIQASGEGSTDTFSLGIPSNAEVCFIDPSDPRHHAAGGWMPDMDLYPIIEEQIQAGGYNVWIRYNCGDADPGYVMEHVTLPPAREGQPNSNFCAGSRDTLLLTNVGVEVRIERLA